MSFVNSIADSAVGRAFIEHGQDLLRFISKRRRYAFGDHRLARETYARLARMPAEDLQRDPQTYLFLVAGNLLHEFELERQPDSAARWIFKLSTAESLTARNEGTADLAARTIKIRATLQELNPVCRAALILHRRDGMSYEQIGEQLGISPIRVRQAFAQGLQHFCRRLRELE